MCEQLFLPDKLSFSLAVCGYLFTSFNYLKMDFLFFEQDDGSSENAYKEFKLEENPKYQHLVRNVSHV